MTTLLVVGEDGWDSSTKRVYGDIAGLRDAKRDKEKRLSSMDEIIKALKLRELSLREFKPLSDLPVVIKSLKDLLALKDIIPLKKIPGNVRWAANTFKKTIERDNTFLDILRFYIEREPKFHNLGSKREVRLFFLPQNFFFQIDVHAGQHASVYYRCPW